MGFLEVTHNRSLVSGTELLILDRHGLDAFDSSSVQNDAKAFVSNTICASITQDHIQMVDAFGLYFVIVIFIQDKQLFSGIPHSPRERRDIEAHDVVDAISVNVAIGSGDSLRG